MKIIDAKTFLIQQHKTGLYDDITENHDTDYGLPFWSAIIKLMEEYSKVINNIPVKEKKCLVCGKDITSTGKELFCEKCGTPIT